MGKSLVLVTFVVSLGAAAAGMGGGYGGGGGGNYGGAGMMQAQPADQRYDSIIDPKKDEAPARREGY